MNRSAIVGKLPADEGIDFRAAIIRTQKNLGNTSGALNQPAGICGDHPSGPFPRAFRGCIDGDERILKTFGVIEHEYLIGLRSAAHWNADENSFVFGVHLHPDALAIL